LQAKKACNLSPASLALSGAASTQSVELAAYCVAAMHIADAVASSTMGRLSDLLGRRIVLTGLGTAGALLPMIFGRLIAALLPILVGLMLIYGFVVIGDSPVLSAAMTEVVAPNRLGSVPAVCSLLGFGAAWYA
jgi:hypothetical protein